MVNPYSCPPYSVAEEVQRRRGVQNNIGIVQIQKILKRKSSREEIKNHKGIDRYRTMDHKDRAGR
jgi:hypothetical protein